MIKVTDEELLGLGGIIQGMSGSPSYKTEEVDRSSNPRFRTRLDKRLRNIHRKYVKTGVYQNVWINVELLLQIR